MKMNSLMMMNSLMKMNAWKDWGNDGHFDRVNPLHPWLINNRQFNLFLMGLEKGEF